MLPDKLRLVLLIAVAVYFLLILLLLKKRSINLKYTLLWLFTGLIMLILLIWPQILVSFISLIGILTPINGLFLVLIAFLMILVMALTSIVSKQSNRIKELTQCIGLMDHRLRKIEGSPDREPSE